MQEGYVKKIRNITWFSIVANVLLTISKITIGIVANSQALIADGVHSLSDFATDGAILIGAKFWSKDADEQHPYGHGRIETLITIAIGGALAAAAIGIGYEAMKTMAEPSTHLPGWSVMVVAILSIAVKETLYRMTKKVGEKVNSRALIANAWHHRTDAISSIPVFVIVIAIRIFPQYSFLDNVAALIVALLLLKIAWDIAKPCFAELMEAQIHVDISETLLNIEKKYPEVQEFHKVRIRRVGNTHFAELHMLTDGNTSVKKAHDITELITQDLLEAHEDLGDVTIHVEPK
ncbi:MAG: cation transporter [Clostridiales bacterium]|nr:cation transporter [Clostridiales bacterium]